MRALDRLPEPALAALLWTVFCLPMAKRSLESHSSAAPGEVAALLDELRAIAQQHDSPTPRLDSNAQLVPQEARLAPPFPSPRFRVTGAPRKSCAEE